MEMFEYNGIATYAKNSKALAQLAPLGWDPGKDMSKMSKDEIKEMMTPNLNKGKALQILQKGPGKN